MKKLLILAFMALLLLCTLPASASSDPNQNYNTSGIVEYQLSESASYTTSSTFTSYNIMGLHPYKIFHRFTDAQYLYMVGFQNELFRKNSGTPVNIQSSFTATVDGVYYGSGQIVLSDRYLDNKVGIYYYFNDINASYAETLVGTKYIEITTPLDVFSHVTSRTSQNRESNSPTSSQPTQPASGKSGGVVWQDYQFGGVDVITSFGKIYKNSYLYSYNANTKTYTINVDRSTSASKLRIYDASGTNYVNENLYSNAHFDLVKPLLDGVILDVTWDFDGGTTRSKTIHLASTTQSGGSTPMHSIAWGKSSYSTGETASISYNIDNPDTGTYAYKIRIGDARNVKLVENLAATSGTYSYPFPSNAMGGTWIAQILATNIATNQTSILAGATTTFTTHDIYSLSFSQSVYGYGDTMQISYANLPSNTQIYLRGTRETSAALETVYSQSYYRTGAGTISLAIPSQTATDYAVFAISNNYTLATDYCKVATSASQVTLSGVVRDAETGARIEGAHVMLDSLGPYTNELGSYSMVRDTGTYYFVVSADGYQTYTTTLNLFSNTVRNVYLTPASFPGNIYGTVTDYKTGERLSGVLVTVKNSTVTKSSLTGSSGFYSVEDLVDNETYSITATLSGYDAYSNSSVTVGQVSFLDIKLIPEGYSGPGSGEADERYSSGHEWTDEEMLSEGRKIAFPLLLLVVLIWVFKVIGG